MYEKKHTPPLSMPGFLRRMALHGCAALALIAGSLLVGMLGFHHFLENKSWTYSFLNAAMILSGMGPVEVQGLKDTGQIFAGFYALYSGLAVIAVTGIMLTPVAHRVMHKLHWDDNGDVREDIDEDAHLPS